MTLPCRTLEGIFERELFEVLLPLASSHQLDIQIEAAEIFQSKQDSFKMMFAGHEIFQKKISGE